MNSILLKIETETIIEETFKISVINTVILLTCVLTLIYLFISHIIAKRKEKKALREISKITEATNVGVVVLDFDSFKIKSANNGFYKLVGFSKDEIDRFYEKKLLSMAKINQTDTLIEQLKSSNDVSLKFEMKTKMDNYLWIYLHGIVQVKREQRTILCVLMNIDSVTRKEEISKFTEERYRIASDVAQDIMFEYDIKNDRMIFSDRYYDVFGRSEVIENYLDYLVTNPNVCKDDNIRIEELINQIKYETVINGEYRLKDISGNFVWVQLKGRKVRSQDGKYRKIYGKLVNVNYFKSELDRLREVSEIDGLTRLNNKSSIISIITNTLKQKQNKVSVMVIDVDNFKKVNDNLGHDYGDMVLSDVASKLKKVTGFTFGRYGGDEFLGISKINDYDQIVDIAKRINQMFEETYESKGIICTISASIGVAITDLNDYESAFKKADDALYNTKKNGKNGYTIIND